MATKVFRKQTFEKNEEVDLDMLMSPKNCVAWEYPYLAVRSTWLYKEPEQHGNHSPCFSMFACLKHPVVLEPGARRRISLGVSIGEDRCWPENHGGLLSIDIADADKMGLNIAPTHLGANFKGEMSVVVFNHGNLAVTIEPRQSIAQLMIFPLSPLGQCEIFRGYNPDDVVEIPEKEFFHNPVRFLLFSKNNQFQWE